ncbi:MAG: hypothetical protein V1751_00990, partial [Pseudomonadota bacterium]
MIKKFSWIICLLAVFSLSFIPGAVAATISLSNGWNLVSSRISISVSNTFSSASNFTSVWKWTTGNKWAVYLSGEDDGGASYAGSKGFDLLSTISPGEGFWVNSNGAQNVTVTGTEETSNTMSLTSGWNLKGLAISSSITVASVFSDSAKFTSIWEWASNKWAVYLPGQTDGGASYAVSKGFSLLSTITPGEGFWVNAGSAQSVNLVETPPLVGKVQEVVGTTDKNSYKAVSGAAVSINNVSVGKTDSQGLFTTSNYSGSSVKVDVQLSGYVPFSQAVTIPDSAQIYIFIQKQDTSSEKLEKTSLSKIMIGPQKATPKVITSSDGTTSITISGMQLQSDITVAVTPYNSLNTILDAKTIAELQLGAVDIVGGGTISVVDSNGNPTTGEAAGFSAQVTPKTNKVLGKWSLDTIETKTGSSGNAGLYMLSKSSGGWKNVGKAKVEQKQNSSVKNMVPNSGVVMTSLDSFIFVMATTETQQVQDNQIVGKVVEKGTEKGIPGAFVGLDGFNTESITDGSGNFTLDFHITDAATLKIQYLFLYAYKDGFRAGLQQIPINPQTNSVSISGPITVGLEPFGDVITISGHVYDESQKPIADARVVLKTPSVLDEIHFQENRIYVGKNDEAHFKWTIMQKPDTPLGEPIVLKTIPPTKGKNFLSKEDVKDLLTNITGDTVFLINLEVTQKVGDNQFREEGQGLVSVYTLGDQKMFQFDFMPDFTNFSIMEAWTDSNGAYEFYDVQKNMLPFVKASAKAAGYKRSEFEKLPLPQAGVITKDFNLPVQTAAQAYGETFETATASDWSTKILSKGEPIDSNTKWQLLDQPEKITMPSKLLNSVMFADMGSVDVPGTIGAITLDTDKSQEFFKVGKATVTFTKDGEQKSIPVELYDWGSPGGGPDGIYDDIWFANPADDLTYDLWYDFDKYPVTQSAEFWSMSLEAGDIIMVSYQGVAKGEDGGLHLLPAFSGSRVFWMGNLKSPDYIGTYYDPELNTGENIVDAILESPVIDLTNFSFAELQMQTWFEVNGGNFCSMALEVALMDDVESGVTVTLESDYGAIDVKKGEFVPLRQFNPFIMMGLGAFGPPAAGGAPLPKEGMALQKGLLQASIPNDNNGDGIPDDWADWASSWTSCAELGITELDPWSDPDWDGFSNLEEYIWGGDPCDYYSPDQDEDGLPDPWEDAQSCGGGYLNMVPWDDSDGDGFTNENEFWMGTNPCDINDPGEGFQPPEPGNLAMGLTSGGEFAPPQWRPFRFNLAPFAGHKIKLSFKFSFKNKTGNYFRGWAIDDVKIVDAESDLDFKIMTPEFGFFDQYHFEEIVQGESWSGNYLFKMTDVFSLDLNTPDAVEQKYIPPDQTITVTQEGLWFTTSIKIAGIDCTVEGNFFNEAYDQLTFYFSGTGLLEKTINGWGNMSIDPDTKNISGYFEAVTS